MSSKEESVEVFSYRIEKLERQLEKLNSRVIELTYKQNEQEKNIAYLDRHMNTLDRVAASTSYGEIILRDEET
jgi:TolA-binding protein